MKNYLEIKDLDKVFKTANGNLKVLDKVNLSISKGEIFGVMGFSGAGKSTVVRCINRLEEPDEGQILINGVDILKLNHRELNAERKNIGMIFQNFNLFDSMTVFQNIEFPLTETKMTKAERAQRVEELVELVGLGKNIHSYPSQLSGGQKQRVGIARAMANNPDIILSDESTSSLDPQTTLQVLDLLKSINQKFGITIIMISHEIEVIKYTCDRVGIMEGGKIVEVGPTSEVLSKPMSKTGNIFVTVENKLDEDWSKKGGNLQK